MGGKVAAPWATPRPPGFPCRCLAGFLPFCKRSGSYSAPPVDHDITLLGSRTRWASARFRLADETFATPDGAVTRPVIHHPGAVAILAQPDPGSLVLVRQYRYPVRRWTVEIPAGTRVPGEVAIATAARELREEVGYTARRLSELGRFFPALGVSDEEMILYRAEGLEDVPAAPEHGELARRQVVQITDLPDLARQGLLCDAKTILVASLLGVPLLSLLTGTVGGGSGSET